MSFYGWELPNFSPVVPKKKGADYLNNIAVQEVFNRITNVALNRFRWIGLPETCNERALEMTLYFYGTALFMRDSDLGFIHTPVNLPGPFNVYYESINRKAYSYNYNKDYTIDNSVLIRENRTQVPPYLTTMNYAAKIADAMRSIDVHTQTIKRPYAIACNEKDRTSVERAINNVADNEIAIFGSTNFLDGKNISVLNLSTSCHLPDMWANVKNYFNQCYTALGVRNAYTEKKERMIVNESQGEENVIRLILESAYNARADACKKINDMFGLNISVEINEDNFADYEREGGPDNVPED